MGTSGVRLRDDGTANMMDRDIGRDRRRHQRLSISKPVRARWGAQEHDGATRDISASGAALQLEAQFEDEGLVELDIKDMSHLSGHVARLFDDGFAVEFDIDPDEEERLVGEIKQIYNATKVEEE